MKNRTQAERLAEALVKDGRVEVTSTSKKYRTFLYGDPENSNDYYFLGKSGALRRGSVVSRSHPTPGYRDKLLRMVPE